MQRKFIEHNPLIHKALGEIMDRRVEAIPVIEHTFSPEFERRMERLIRTQEKPYYRLVNTNAKKAVLALAAAFILLITMVFSVSALREPVIRFIVEVYEKFSTVFFSNHEDALAPPTSLETNYEPSWLPEGYALEDAMTMATDYLRMDYYAKGSDYIVLQQYALSNGMNFDTEGVEIQSALIHGKAAIMYQNKGTWTLIWDNELYGFTLSGPEGAEDILRIAESLREK